MASSVITVSRLWVEKLDLAGFSLERVCLGKIRFSGLLDAEIKTFHFITSMVIQLKPLFIAQLVFLYNLPSVHGSIKF